jgi:hypothetical protein
MTTKHSPLHVLKRQADTIAATLKAAERGEKINVRFGERIAAARGRDSLTIGVFMDDKVIQITLPWSTIRDVTEAALSDYIVDQMREARGTIQ